LLTHHRRCDGAPQAGHRRRRTARRAADASRARRRSPGGLARLARRETTSQPEVIAMKLPQTLASFVMFAALGLGCHPAVKMETPDGFAELSHSGSYDWRAASAHGVVLAMRAEKNEPRANLDFWKDAVDVRVRRQGYTPEGQASVKSADGRDGRQLRYVRVDD